MQGAHVARRHCAAIERAADSHHHLSRDQRVRVSRRERRQAADLVDLEHRDACLAVVIDKARWMQGSVAGDQHRHRARACYHGCGGHYVAVRGDQIAGASNHPWLVLRDDADDGGFRLGSDLDDCRLLGDGHA
jgi:hypothetical protein